MTYKPLKEQRFKDTHIAVYRNGDGFMGVIRWPPRSETRYGANLDALWTELVRDRGVVHPDYFGWDGALRRFRTMFPQGFDDPLYGPQERTDKAAASADLIRDCPLDAALAGKADAVAAARAIKATILLHPIREKPKLLALCQGPQGAEFLQAAARIAAGDHENGFGAMVPLLAAAGTRNWPQATYFPFLWNPGTQMFLRPGVTRDFASRVGHPFSENYQSEPNARTYRHLLDLAQQVRAHAGALTPATRALDGIDVQSFIWVVSERYGPAAEEDLNQKRRVLQSERTVEARPSKI